MDAKTVNTVLLLCNKFYQGLNRNCKDPEQASALLFFFFHRYSICIVTNLTNLLYTFGRVTLNLWHDLTSGYYKIAVMVKTGNKVPSNCIDEYVYSKIPQYIYTVCEVFREKNKTTCYHDNMITLS
jgi:hypothetical protein